MATKMKEYLVRQDIKQIELAQKLHIDPSLLSKIVKGWIDPKAELKNHICQILNVQESDIFK